MLSVSLQAFEYAQHLLGWLTISTVCHQFGVAQNSVEWRSQFVTHTHIGEELRLVLACLLKLAALVLDFVEYSNVLDRNHRLVGEGCNEIDLLFRERVDRRPRQEYAANRPPLAEERDAQRSTKASQLRRIE